VSRFVGPAHLLLLGLAMAHYQADIKQAIIMLAPDSTKLQPVKATARLLRSVQRQPERIRK